MKQTILLLIATLFVTVSCQPAPTPTSVPPTAMPSTTTPLPAQPTTTAIPAPGVHIKIMPLGDSITYGYFDFSYGGYMHLLGTLLTNDGYQVDFVGSVKNVATNPEIDSEAHGTGWTMPQFMKQIDSNGWLETYQPNLILLHLGANDIGKGQADAAPANLSALLDDILTRLPKTHVIVAQITPKRVHTNDFTKTYNAAIPGIVASKGARVSMVDMQNILTSDDYVDADHLTNGGYDKMARVWEPAIRAVMPISPTTPLSATTTP